MLRDSFKSFRLTLLLFTFLLPHVALAAATQLTFTTDPQTVLPGEISGTLTVQLQDGSGAPAMAAETMDVEFVSTSLTGEFLSPTTGSTVSKTISTGSANKNFRYRDTTVGNFMLTIKVKGRVSGIEFVAAQGVVISSGSTATTTATSTTPVSTSGPVSASNVTVITTSYVYYSANSLSSTTPTATLELGAGRARLGTVGSPMEFKVETNVSYTKNSEFVWNFGDGTEATGDILTHTYEYPGEYIVMLNAVSQGEAAVARTKVRVLEAALRVTHADHNRIEVANDSEEEVSLFGRVLWTPGGSFIFPRDTILEGGERVSFGAKITGLHPADTASVQILVVGDTERPEIGEKLALEKATRITELQSSIAALQLEMVRMSVGRAVTAAPSPIAEPIQPEVEVETATQAASASESISQLPVGWLETIKHFFFGTP